MRSEYKFFVVYDKDDEVIAIGSSKECAAQLRKSISAFKTIVNRHRDAGAGQMAVVVLDNNEEDDDDYNVPQAGNAGEEALCRAEKEYPSEG